MLLYRFPPHTHPGGLIRRLRRTVREKVKVKRHEEKVTGEQGVEIFFS